MADPRRFPANFNRADDERNNKHTRAKHREKYHRFFLHTEDESFLQDSLTHFNTHEAEFIVALCPHIILQGYKTSEVTILTCFSGQLHQIRQLMRTHTLLNDVRAAVVDGYQGEECDIILMSFVRSNERGKIGFLTDTRRINVALSRARKGLYCIGNFNCIASKNGKFWESLLEHLEEEKVIGPKLNLYCQNHREEAEAVHSRECFESIRDGGCDKACNERMNCGHTCEKKCYIIDKEHTSTFSHCSKPCGKQSKNCIHKCPKLCHYDDVECGRCSVQVEKSRNPCTKFLRCQHKCTLQCNQNCGKTPCPGITQTKSPCGHFVYIKCGEKDDIEKLLKACKEPCSKVLKCGYPCQGSCSECKLGRLHKSCQEKCTNLLICGHPCPDNCSVECTPCEQNFQNRCSHNKCNRPCGAPCRPCMEKCNWRCDHSQCTRLCHEQCGRELCEQPNCEKCGKISTSFGWHFVLNRRFVQIATKMKCMRYSSEKNKWKALASSDW